MIVLARFNALDIYALVDLFSNSRVDFLEVAFLLGLSELS
jgi:hypothetical protein